MAYSRKDTTNNFAEYWGLIHGLREAQRSHFEPLYVIGDSALITSQQRMHRSLDSTDWHVYTRQVDDSRIASTSEDGTITTVPSTRWRTAIAMDTRTSTQVHFPTHRAAFNNLTQDLDNDVHALAYAKFGRPKVIGQHKAASHRTKRTCHPGQRLFSIQK
ncbi:reverse transcriptase, partial [Globisporangium splendens]